MRKTPLTLLLLPILLISLVQHTFACACCAEGGEYLAGKAELGEYHKEILTGMEYARISSLYIDAAGFEGLSGLAGMEEAWDASRTGEEFGEISTDGKFANGDWRWSFRIGDLAGTIALPAASDYEYLKADIHDGKRSGGGGPLLYKEMRFRGKVGSGTGFFEEGLKKGAEFLLVFQGRGNGCDNVEDFTHWRLSVRGPDADYALFGELASGAPIEEGSVVPAPEFDDHPASAWNGRKRALNLSSHPSARMFRTRLREAWAGDVNFAGNYIITYWGCGTNCLVGAIIDVKTGRVYFPDELQGMGVGLPGTDLEREPLEYRKDSSLFVFYGATGEEAEAGTRWLLWDGGKFIKIAEKPE